MARNRIEIAENFGWSVREVYKAIDCWRCLYKRQPESSITLDEYLSMMMENGLRPDMIGLNRGKYSLARFNDLGAYSVANCRFIKIEDNISERKEGYQLNPEFRRKMSEIALKRDRVQCVNCGGSFTKGMHTRWHGENCKKIVEKES